MNKQEKALIGEHTGTLAGQRDRAYKVIGLLKEERSQYPRGSKVTRQLLKAITEAEHKHEELNVAYYNVKLLPQQLGLLFDADYLEAWHEAHSKHEKANRQTKKLRSLRAKYEIDNHIEQFHIDRQEAL